MGRLFRVVLSAYLGAWAADVGWGLASGARAPTVLSMLGAAYVTLMTSVAEYDERSR